MLFNSIEYFVFFLFIFCIYWAMAHKFRKYWLLVASWLFYASWSPSFLIHFILILLINYLFLLKIYKSQNKYIFLVIILSLNFVNLAFFKYFYFIVETLKLFSSWDVLYKISVNEFSIIPQIILPLAISFYTFQIVAFHVDVYRNEVQALPSVQNYLLFIMFFPQLIAGPIVRHNELLPQLEEKKSPENIDITKGLGLIGVGIVKKVFIADFLSPVVSSISLNPESYDSLSILTSIYFFSLVVYCDFAGYTDLARGTALLLGFSLPFNFRGPFFQMSFTDHWKRWHLTLTSWIRDYIYIPLGGNKSGVYRTFINSIITFFLAGLWHGAGWGFAIWGFINGFALSMERLIFKDLNLVKEPATWANAVVNGKVNYYKLTYRILKFLIIYSSIAIIGIFFNAGTDIDRALAIWKGLLTNGLNGKTVALTGKHFIVICLFIFLHYLEYNDFHLKSNLMIKLQKMYKIWIPVSAIIILLYCSAYVDSDIPFVYFQF